MTFSISLIHVTLLATMVFIGAGLVRLLQRELGTDGALTATVPLSLNIWRAIGILPILFAGSALCLTGLPGGVVMDIAAAGVVWGALWYLAGWQIARSHTPSSGVLTVLALYGLHLGLIVTLSRTWLTDGIPQQRWVLESAALGLAAVAVLWLLRAPFTKGWEPLKEDSVWSLSTTWWYHWLAGPRGVRTSLGFLGFGGLLATAHVMTHRDYPVYACVFVAYQLGATTLLTRCTSHRFIHQTWKGWWRRWWPAFVVCVINVVLPIIAADFSPSVCILVCLTAILLFINERKVAVILFAVMAFGLLFVDQTGLVQRYHDRVRLVQAPFYAANSQMAVNRWAVARGNLAGRGTGRLVVIHAKARRNHGNSVPVVRPEIMLSHTDAIMTTVAEMTGAIGVVATLTLYGVLVCFLFAAARRAEKMWERIFLAQAGTLLGITAVWTSGWTVGAHVVMAGLAMPLLAFGPVPQLFWTIVLLLSVRLAAFTGFAPASDAVFDSVSSRSPYAALASWGRESLIPIVLCAWLAFICCDCFMIGTVHSAETLRSIFHDRKTQGDVLAALDRGKIYPAPTGALVAYGDDPQEQRRLERYIHHDPPYLKVIRDAQGEMEAQSISENFTQSDSSDTGRWLRAASVTPP